MQLVMTAFSFLFVVNVLKRYSNTLSNHVVEKHRHSALSNGTHDAPLDNVAVRDYR